MRTYDGFHGFCPGFHRDGGGLSLRGITGTFSVVDGGATLGSMLETAPCIGMILGLTWSDIFVCRGDLDICLFLVLDRDLPLYLDLDVDLDLDLVLLLDLDREGDLVLDLDLDLDTDRLLERVQLLDLEDDLNFLCDVE